MLSAIRAFFSTSIEKIVADIQTKIDALHLHADVQEAKAKAHAEAAALKATAARDAALVAARARTLAERFKSLIA